MNIAQSGSIRPVAPPSSVLVAVRMRRGAGQDGHQASGPASTPTAGRSAGIGFTDTMDTNRSIPAGQRPGGIAGKDLGMEADRIQPPRGHLDKVRVDSMLVTR